MDNRIEKAFDVANYMATLSAHRRIILEEFSQKLVYYIDGATFKITPELINFTKTMIDLGHTAQVAFVDVNNFPVIIEDTQLFLDTIIKIYFEAINSYATQFSELKSKRRVQDIISL